MKRLAKVGIVLLAVGVGLAAAAAVALKVLLPPEKARQLVTDSARKALKREVRLKGLSLGPLHGLVVSGLELSEEPDFGAGVFAEASSLQVRLKLLALLRRKIVVDSISVEGLKLTLVRDKNGMLRLPQMGAAGSAGAPAAAAAAAPFQLAVRKASVNGSEVVFRDEKDGSQWAIAGLSAKVSDFSLDRPFDMQAAFSVAGKAQSRPLNAAVVFAGRLDPAGGDPMKMSALIRKLSVRESSGYGLLASGSVSAGPERKAELKAALSSQGSELLDADVQAKPSRDEGFTDIRFALRTQGVSKETLARLGAPAGLKLPAAKIEGTVRLERDEAQFEGLLIRTAAGTAALDGFVRDLRGKPRPELKATLKLDLPAFQSADLPALALPAGLSVPASHIEGGLELGAAEIRLRALRVKSGGNDLEADGVVRGLGQKASAEVTLKCRSFVLEELAPLWPATRDMRLTGRGFFALDVRGELPRPLLAGKLQFQGLGAKVAGLKLSEFAGQAKFDERRLDAPNIKGLVADGVLMMDLTVKDYSKAADIDFEAELSRFDLGAFLAAKAAMAKPEPAHISAAGGESPRPQPIRAKGKLTVAKLVHPNAQAKDVKLSWELAGLTPDLKTLDGWAKLSVAGGSFNNLGLMATESRVLKVLVLPLVVLQKIGGIGGIRLFPDLNNIEFSEIGGDYAFQKGVMKIRDSHLYSDAVRAETTGSIDLPSEKLDLLVTAQVGRVAPIDFGVTGSFDKPVTKAKIGKFLAEPAKQLLQNIFK